MNREPDWDKLSAHELSRLAALNAWHNGKILKEIKTLLLIMFFGGALVAHRLMTGSWW